MVRPALHPLSVFAIVLLATGGLVLPLLVPLPLTPADAALATLVCAIVPPVVVAIRRRATPPERFGWRYTSAFLPLLAIGFMSVAVLAPPDPLTQLRWTGPAFGLALLGAYAQVAFQLDHGFGTR